MEIFEKIEKALQSEEADKILDFGGFHIQDKVKTHSQQGMVLIAKNKIRKTFAIKFYRPTDKDPKILKEGVENFIREVTILASLNHKNIVNVYTGGKAKWVEKENLWIINEGFDKKHFGNTDEALFYIMDFIKGNDISSVFPDPLKQNSKNPKFKQIPIYEQLKLFEDMISQLSKAINYYHSKKITHKDIKSDNIRFSTEDSTFIIVDFGFARHFTSPQDLSTITRTENLDIESIKAKNYELNDMGQFSEMLLRILPSFEGEYGINRYQEIKSAIEKGKDPKLDHRYKNMQEFHNSVRQYFLTESGWKFELKLDGFLAPNRFGKFDSKLRIPVSGSVLLSKEIRAIIDTPQFQRLRGVRQLGPTIFVFPGANHTRFEHSLGAYFLALKYLEKLLSIPNFKSICEPIEDSIKLFTLSALLHDIGHYPYSHWIEEIEKFPNGMKLPTHEERAQEIICSGTIGEILHDEWKVDPKTLSEIIASKHIKGKKELVNSFINSIIDVDTLDYLLRDSVHCGVNYGEGIDLERLLDSLYINPNTKRLCLTEKGRSALLSILSCRNVMYQEVYWHKTVRACDAMFKRFLYEYIKDYGKEINMIKESFNYSDDQFINKLYRGSRKNKKLNDLISPFAMNKNRLLYKPAYVFYNSNAEEEPTDTKQFFRKVIDMKYEDLVEMGHNLVTSLNDHLGLNIQNLDILIEKTPAREEHEYTRLEGFEIWNTKKKRFEGYPKELEGLNKYLLGNRQAYVFCNPRYYDNLKGLSVEKWGEIFGDT